LAGCASYKNLDLVGWEQGGDFSGVGVFNLFHYELGAFVVGLIRVFAVRIRIVTGEDVKSFPHKTMCEAANTAEHIHNRTRFRRPPTHHSHFTQFNPRAKYILSHAKLESHIEDRIWKISARNLWPDVVHVSQESPGWDKTRRLGDCVSRKCRSFEKGLGPDRL
jgi:hypothetical protein